MENVKPKKIASVQNFKWQFSGNKVSVLYTVVCNIDYNIIKSMISFPVN